MRKLLLTAITLLATAALAHADATFNFAEPETLTATWTNPATQAVEAFTFPADVTQDNYESLGASWNAGGYYSLVDKTITNGNVAITTANLNGSSGVRLFYPTTTTNSIGIRMYSSETTLTVATTDGTDIVAIAVGGKTLTNIKSVDTGTKGGTATALTWEGSAQSVTFTCTTTRAELYTMTVTTDDPSAAPNAPTFSVKEGTYYEALSVDIAAATGCDIYYTTDGTTPTAATATKYADGQPVEIAATTTLMAIAVRNGLSSDVATATYTITTRPTVGSIAEAMQQTGEFVVGFDATVAYCSGKNIYVTDGTDFTEYYPSAAPSPAYEAGTIIKGGWNATFTIYTNYGNYIPEIVPVGAFAPATEAGTFTPRVCAAANVTAAMVNHVIVLSRVTFAEDTPATKTSFTATAGETAVTFYNNFTLEAQAAGDYDVTAIVCVYNDAVQFYPIAYAPAGSAAGIADIEAIDPAAADYYNLQGVRVDPATARGLLIMRQGARAAKIIK